MGWGDSWEKVPKPFGQVMKEFNEEAIQNKFSEIKSELEGFVKSKEITLQIPIKGGWQTRTINAIQVGDLAVCFDNEDEEIGLVTHVPTLTRFDNAIPDGEWTQEQLIRWCWKVQQSTDLWQAICSYDNSNYKTISQNFLDALKKHCLLVGVE